MAKKKTAQDSRLALLHAARGLFAAHGYAGVAVREIVALAGVNISLVSYHFGGKEGLYRACMESVWAHDLALARAHLTAPASAAELRARVEAFAAHFLASHARDLEMIRLVSRELDDDSPLFRELFRNDLVGVYAALAAFFRDAQRRGLLRAELDPPQVAGFLYGILLHHLRIDPVRERYFQRSLKDPEHRRLLVRHVVAITLDGIMARA